MVATAPRPGQRDGLVPHEAWWMVEMFPAFETLGQRLQRLRDERGLHQRDVVTAIGYPETKQSSLSRYERDQFGREYDEAFLLRLEQFFEQPEESLQYLAFKTHQYLRSRKELPGPAIALPNEPGLREVITEIIEFAPEQMPGVAQQLRVLRLTLDEPVDRAEDARDETAS